MRERGMKSMTGIWDGIKVCGRLCGRLLVIMLLWTSLLWVVGSYRAQHFLNWEELATFSDKWPAALRGWIDRW